MRLRLKWSLMASKGADGADGADGQDGADGADGTNGTNGTKTHESPRTGRTGSTVSMGGASAWEGPWGPAEAYVADDVVSRNGSTYIAFSQRAGSAPESSPAK